MIKPDNKDHLNNPLERELDRLHVIRQLYLLEVEWVPAGQGVITFPNTRIDKPIMYALRSGKWRVKGKKVWYRSKGLQKFVDEYVRHKE